MALCAGCGLAPAGGGGTLAAGGQLAHVILLPRPQPADWDGREGADGLEAMVLLLDANGRPAEPRGELVLELQSFSPDARSPVRSLRTWEFDAKAVRSALRPTPLGPAATLYLAWDKLPPGEAASLRATCRRPGGPAIQSAAATLPLEPPAAGESDSLPRQVMIQAAIFEVQFDSPPASAGRNLDFFICGGPWPAPLLEPLRPLSAPQLMAVSGQPARVAVQNRVPVLRPGGQAGGAIDYVELGVTMELVPQVLDGWVALDVACELMLPKSPSLRTAEDVRRVRAASSVLLRTGQTAIGLLRVDPPPPASAAPASAPTPPRGPSGALVVALTVNSLRAGPGAQP